jgi:hypothetical protein
VKRAWLVGVLLFACADEAEVALPASVEGAVAGVSIDVTDAAGSVEVFEPAIGGVNPNEVATSVFTLEVSRSANLCTGRGVRPDDASLTIRLTTKGSVVLPGRYALGAEGHALDARMIGTDGACKLHFDEKPSGGYLDLESVDTGSKRAKGTFDLGFDKGSLRGSFDVSLCLPTAGLPSACLK